MFVIGYCHPPYACCCPCCGWWAKGGICDGSMRSVDMSEERQVRCIIQYSVHLRTTVSVVSITHRSISAGHNPLVVIRVNADKVLIVSRDGTTGQFLQFSLRHLGPSPDPRVHNMWHALQETHGCQTHGHTHASPRKGKEVSISTTKNNENSSRNVIVQTANCHLSSGDLESSVE